MLMRWWSILGHIQAVVLIVTALAAPCRAVATLDAVNDVGGGAGAHNLQPSNFWAQSFTAGVDGLLSQVDVQVGKFSGATGDVRFELRPLVNGTPTLDDKGMLFVSSISVSDIPVISSLSDPPPFVSVDVSSAGIHAKPGDQYAISLRRSGTAPAVAVRSRANSYADGTGFFRSLLSSPWTTRIEDLGFQTWVDPTPTAPYKLRVDATFDMKYLPLATPTLVEGEKDMLIGGFDAERPIMEFPLEDLPAGAEIQAAHLELDFYVSSGAPRIEIMGFAGDGLASFSDISAPGNLLATTGPTSASSSPELPIDANYIKSLVGVASHLGVRMRGLDGVEYVGFSTTEDDFPVTLPPRLVIEYTLPAANGDFNDDGNVDGHDFLHWQQGLSAEFTASHLDQWKSNFGASSAESAATPTPEPPAWVQLIAMGPLVCLSRGSRVRRCRLALARQSPWAV